MPNRSHLIKNHDLNRYTRPAMAIKAAIAKYDADARRLQKDPTLFDGERIRRQAEAKAAAEAVIRTHRREIAEAVADHRSWSTQHTDDAPSGEEASRRMYYSQRAQAELANLSPADALALIQRMAATGDTERAQEYVAAARGRVPAGQLAPVERAVESADTSGARHWGKAVDAIDYQTGWLDEHITRLMEQAGRMSVAAREGREPEEELSLRRLDLWSQGLEVHAGSAFAASIEAQGKWSDVAASLATAGTEGWDAPGADDQPTEEPPAEVGADQ